MSRAVALITGANKGIGFATSKALSFNHNYRVLMGVRDQSRGQQALHDLMMTGVASASLLSLDVNDSNSIAAAAHSIKSSTDGGLDVLVNNAAIAIHTPEVSSRVVEPIMQTNYFGAELVTRHMLPLLRPNGRIVNVSSMLTNTALKAISPALREKLLAPDLSLAGLNALMRKYVEDVAAGRWQEEGWTVPYGVSKIGLSLLTRIIARENPHLIVNHCCPGYVNTDMTEHKGVRTPDEGAATIVHCATLPVGSPSGHFFRDAKTRPWPSPTVTPSAAS